MLWLASRRVDSKREVCRQGFIEVCSWGPHLHGSEGKGNPPVLLTEAGDGALCMPLLPLPSPWTLVLAHGVAMAQKLRWGRTVLGDTL